MPYVPSTSDIKRLGDAVERASFSEGERIMWLFAFAGMLVLDGFLLAGGGTWYGIVGALGVFAVMYWRIRGGHLVEVDRELHGIGLRTQSQRAFTALMFRQALTGRNALRVKPQHDPFAAWGQVVERAQAADEEG